MAGTGARGPTAKDPSTTARRNKSSTKATLRVATDHDVPSLPPAGDWLPRWEFTSEYEPAEWSPAVERWWNDIWSSPMSNEFIDSDIHGLYLACFYLQQTLNPALKMAERLKASSAYESCVRNYGLNPMSRRTLQWEIERTDEAVAKGEARRNRGQNSDAPKSAPSAAWDPRAVDESAEENPYASA